MKKLLLTAVLTFSTLASAQTLNITSAFAPGAAQFGASYQTAVSQGVSGEFGVGVTTAGVYDAFAGINAHLNNNFYVPLRVGAVLSGAPTAFYGSLGLGAQVKASSNLAVFGELNSRVYFNNNLQVGFPAARFGVKVNLK